MFKAFSLFLLAFSLSACSGSKPKLHELNGSTMGTTYSVKFLSSKPSKDIKVIHQDIESVLKKVNAQMSTYIPSSEISLFNQSKKGVVSQISPWFGEALQVSLDLAALTKGAFDPSIGPLVNLWGFGPDKHKSVPSDELIRKTKNLVGFTKLSLTNSSPNVWSLKKDIDGLKIDLSASAKGYGVDKVSELLLSKDLKNHLVEIGGEMRASGTKLGKAPWRVAIERPDQGFKSQRAIQEVIHLKGISLATSGNYRNFFESQGKIYPHTISSADGRPVKSNLLSVSVLHEACVSADALATAFMVMGFKKAFNFAKENNVAALFIVASEETGENIDKAQAQVFKTDSFKTLTEDL